MVNTHSRKNFGGTLGLSLAGFLALLLGTGATAALGEIDSYRLQVIGAAPCAKRALSFEGFESALSWVSLGGLGVALVAGVVALVLARGRSSVAGPVLLVVVSALLLTLAVVSHSSPFDFDSSSLPTCGAMGGLDGL